MPSSRPKTRQVSTETNSSRSLIDGFAKSWENTVVSRIKSPELRKIASEPGPLLWSIFFLLLWPTLFYEAADGIWGRTVSIWGDWARDLTFTNRFATYPPWLWFKQHPLYVGTGFQYHFLQNFIASVFQRMGFGLALSQLLLAIPSTIAAVWLLYAFYRRETGSRALANVGVALLFMGGGLGFLYRLRGIEPNVYSMWADQGMTMGSMFAHLLIPQKATMLGLVMALVIFFGWESPDKRKRLATAVLMGALPLVHAHTFFAVFVTAAIMVVLRRDRWREYVAPAALAGAVAVLVLVAFHRNSQAGGYLHWMPGWIAYQGAKPPGWIWFWFLNWSVFLPLVVYSLWKVPQSRGVFAYSGIALFVAGNLIRFQPWDWDNTKIFLLSYAFLIPAVVLGLAEIWRKRPAGKAGAVALAVLMMGTGVIEIWRELPWGATGFRLFSRQEMQLAAEFKKHLTPEDVVLVADHHHDWVSALAGAQIVMGYTGLIWANITDYHGRQAEVRRMFTGDVDLLKRFNVTYVVINDEARNVYRPNIQFFERFPKVLASPLATVYKLSP